MGLNIPNRVGHLAIHLIINMGMHGTRGEEDQTLKTIDGGLEEMEDGTIHTPTIITIDFIRMDLEVLGFKITLIS